MHHNYYFLRQLTTQLRNKILGWKLGTCFSQNKDELIIGLYEPSGKGEFFIKAHLASYFCCLQFPETFHRAKRNSVDLFSTLLDQPLGEIRQFENERSFWLRFGTQGLLFKMHGNRANVLLTDGGKVVELFRHSLANDLSLDIESLDRKLSTSRTAFDQAECDPRKLYPTFGKLPMEHLQQQNYDQKNSDEQWNMLQSLVRRLENPKEYFLVEWNGAMHLSLLPVGEVVEKLDNPISALNAFFFRKIKRIRVDSVKNQLVQTLEKQKKQSSQYIQKNQRTLEKLETGLQHQQVADILMANLHQVPKGASEVDLFDFYHNEITQIKLNRLLSPQKNAERYYRKAKNQKLEVAQLQKNIAQKQTQLNQTQMHLNALQPMDDPKELLQYAQDHQLVDAATKEAKTFPFRSFDIHGYTVWVGKSAKNNDELTRHYAHKEDLWLHAKDVSGSHVVIKQQPGKPAPPYVIEQAAQIAAYYSKRKTDSLCPVIVTPRKYVRKSKHMAPGAVVIEREEIVMVEPKLPDQKK